MSAEPNNMTEEQLDHSATVGESFAKICMRAALQAQLSPSDIMNVIGNLLCLNFQSIANLTVAEKLEEYDALVAYTREVLIERLNCPDCSGETKQ